MSASPLAVGQIGLGLAAAAHHKGYASHLQVRAVCDCNVERARSFARVHGVEQVFGDFGDMLQRADIDAVDITTPTFLHAPVAQLGPQYKAGPT